MSGAVDRGLSAPGFRLRRLEVCNWGAFDARRWTMINAPSFAHSRINLGGADLVIEADGFVEPEPEPGAWSPSSPYPLPCRNSSMMDSSAEMTSSRSTRDLLKRICRLNALVVGR